MGSLELIIGPMFSGKTELLIEKYNEKKLHENIVAFNYYKDTRYGNDKIISHSGKFISSINIEFLSEIINNENFNLYKFIYINEAQFFTNLKFYIVQFVEKYNKNVVLCGLDSDYKREKFGEIWDLIPFADNIYKLNGNCHTCDKKSLFTFRITNEKDQEIIGNDNYIPLCRKCYILKI